MLIDQYVIVAPADGDDVQVVVVIDIDELCAVVVLVAGGDGVALPVVALFLEDVDVAVARIGQIVLADDHIHVAVAIQIAHVEALRADDVADDVFGPQVGRIGRVLIPGHRPRDTDTLEAGYQIGVAVAVHVDQAVAVDLVGGVGDGVAGPGGGVILQPGLAQGQVHVAVAVDVGGAQFLVGHGRGEGR